jgi:integrase
MSVIDDGALPADFPLSVASNGQYCKKFKGQRHHFGATSAGWKAALERFNHDWPYILLGKVPPPMRRDGEPDPHSLEYIATEFIKREQKRCERGQITGGSLNDIRQAIEIAVAHMGKKKLVRHLMPDDFADLRHALSFVWRKEGEGESAKWVQTGERIGPSLLKKRIIHVRAMFNWAGPDKAKLLSERPSYGDDFRLVSDATVLKAQKNKERQHGAKRWEVDEIESIRNALKNEPQLLAMFMLSINCGFTAADCAALPWSSVDLKKGWIDFARVKTGVDRPHIALWPETVAALKLVKELELSPAPGLADLVVHQPRGDNGEAIGEPIRLKDCVFITSKGRPWVQRSVKTDKNGLPESEVHKDALAQEFNKVLTTLNIKRPGVGFAAGRHTFESHALRVADKHLVDAVMGHSTGEMSQRYDHALDEDRRALANGVRARLLPKAQQGDELAATGATTGHMRLAR